jgi:hypothetical protein
MSDFSGLVSSICALASDSLDRCIARLHRLEADRPGLERFARRPWPKASLAFSGINPLSSVFARSWSRKAGRVERNSSAVISCFGLDLRRNRPSGREMHSKRKRS